MVLLDEVVLPMQLKLWIFTINDIISSDGRSSIWFIANFTNASRRFSARLDFYTDLFEKFL